jgi:hypothetical protein
MRKQSVIAVLIGAALICAALVSATFPKRALAGSSEKYIHIRVNQVDDDEKVSVNLPLSMAAKILPAIHHGELHDGKVRIGHGDLDSADVQAILSAVASAPDGEFVTVHEKDQEVRVAKSKGNLIVRVLDTHKAETPEKNSRGPEKVEITVPMTVVTALVKADQKELNIGAALQALGESGDALLVTVHDATNDVRIWVDSKNSED